MSIELVAKALKVEGLNPTQKLVLVGLCNYSNEDREAWPSQKTLSQIACVSTRQVRTILTTLESLGVISRAHRKTKDGQYTSDFFNIHDDKFDQIFSASSGSQFPTASGSEVPPVQRKSGVKSSGSPLPPNRHKNRQLVNRQEKTNERPTLEQKKSSFKKPDLLELENYFRERGSTNPKFESEYFFDYYESIGWVVGKHKLMKCWKSAVRNWLRSNVKNNVSNHASTRTGSNVVEFSL